MNRRAFLAALATLLSLALTTACSAPLSGGLTPSGARTVVSSPSPPSAPSPEPTTTAIPGPSPQPTASATPIAPTLAATPTTIVISPTLAATVAPTRTAVTAIPGSACTDVATFVADVTVPDKSAVAPGQTFTKTWRLRNTGTCTWKGGYAMAFVSGPTMTQAKSVPVPETQSGATVDLAVPMTAPATPGTYQSFWVLRSPNGTQFGPQVWALIEVTGSAAGSPPSTGALSSGVYVTQLETDPAQPRFNEPVGFRMTLNNTNPGSQTLRWFVKLYQCTETPCTEAQLKSSLVNLERSFGETIVVESTVLPGTMQVAGPVHWVAGAGACVYTAVPHYFEPAGQGVVPLLKPDGVPLYYTFDVCQKPQ